MIGFDWQTWYNGQCVQSQFLLPYDCYMDHFLDGWWRDEDEASHRSGLFASFHEN